MNKVFITATLIIFAVSLVFGAEISGQDQTGKVVGIWQSVNDVEGKPQAVITISRAEKQFAGKFVFRGLTIDDQENVTLELPLTNISFDGTIFSFQVAFPGAEKTVTDWELKLRNDNEAVFDLSKENGKAVEDSLSFVMKKAKTN